MAAASRRKRSRLVCLLTAVLGLPSAAGFGLSTVGASCAGVRAAADGVLVTRGSSSAVARAERSRGQRAGRGSRERGGEGRPGREHLITCKVASPRKYGSADWYTNIQNLPKSRLLYNIKDHLLFNTGFAFVVSMIHYLTPQHIIDDLHVSPIPHSIMSGALGLLLVFRTNAAYNRFWEARKVWGGVTNTCRSMARLGAVALGPDSVEWQEMKEYLRMFPFLLKQHLQDDRVDEELAFSTLARDKVMRLQEDPNPPLFACQLMSEILAQAYSQGGTGQSQGGRVPDFTSVTYRMEMEHGLTSLIDALGMCERILTTPVPRGYSRHTSRFLTVYGVTLPLVLVPHTELFTAPVVAAVCWGLFSIEEIAYFIEQPFDPEYRQLDLLAYAEKIARDVERVTVKSGLGRHDPSSSPWLPGCAGNGGGRGLLSSHQAKLQQLQQAQWQQQHQQEVDEKLRQQQQQQEQQQAGGGMGGAVNGDDSSRTDGGNIQVDGLSRSWGGGSDNDIIA